jgi:endonuclease/exonuclease/phosphatase (EEP) superfamily protein YafD
MKSGLLALGVLLILATAAPFVRSEEWWVRALGFPRLEIAILLALVLVAFLFVYRPARTVDNIFLLALTASLGYQVYRIAPYTPLWTPEVVNSASCNESSRIRLLTANVLMDNRRAGDFLSLVWTHEPDLILAVETDQWWDERLSVLDGDYPFAVKHPRDNTYGLHLFSKLELGAPEVRFLIEDYVPSVRTGVRLRSGDWIDFYGVHPRPPKPQQDTEERDAEILIVAKEVKANERPAIVAGDLNDVAWSHTTRLFQRISGTLDPRIGRGRFSTYHAEYPIFRWPLDHVFHEESFKLGEMKLLAFFGSDHFPVLAELCFEPEAKLRQEAPQAGPEAREEAQGTIQEGRNDGD